MGVVRIHTLWFRERDAVQIYDDLIRYNSEGKNIRVGLVGAGFMGRGIVEVLEMTPGMTVSVVSDIELERAQACFELVGISRIREIDRPGDAAKLDLGRERIICSDHRVVTALDGIDMVIEATGKPNVGAEVAHAALMQGKHVGMLNVETDATAGYYLNSLARERGLVYTVCAGDEPAAVKELIDFARSCGFTVVAAGKGKNNPLDRTATPESLSERARSMGLNPYMLTEFVDGSKTMVEMSCVANAAGLMVDVRNMHGPSANIDTLTNVFRLKENSGILEREGVVDFVIGDLTPGVFAVVHHDGPIANETLRYLKVGDGPQYLLYRPYHLTNLEVPDSVGWAVLHGKPTLATVTIPSTEVTTIAKRDLQRGEVIDSLGGSTVYGGVENVEQARKEHLLPLGLSVGSELLEDVEMGRLITYDQVRLKDSSLLKFRRIQDGMHGRNS
jgi:predicted homoserine dehydrogenase-like protein